jgi:hypothetical protein
VAASRGSGSEKVIFDYLKGLRLTISIVLGTGLGGEGAIRGERSDEDGGETRRGFGDGRRDQEAEGGQHFSRFSVPEESRETRRRDPH